MKARLASLFLPLIVPCFPVSTAQAGSIELVQPDALDVARELGFNIAKFSVKFAEPVYATLSVTVFPLDGTEGAKHERTTTRALKEHAFSFTIKDHDAMAKVLGFLPNPANAGTMEFTVFHPMAAFSLREKVPYGKPVPGQQLVSFVERQSLEELELDKPIPLIIKGGPFDDKNPAPKNFRENYTKAPGFYLLEVTFSKTKPAEEKPAPEADPGTVPEAVPNTAPDAAPAAK